MAEQEPQSPRRMPGGALPPRYARPRAPEANGHTPAPPAAADLHRLDAEEAEETRESHGFRRVAEIVPDATVAASGRPAMVVIVATLVVIGVVVLAVVLYRMAPP